VWSGSEVKELYIDNLNDKPVRDMLRVLFRRHIYSVVFDGLLICLIV